MVTAIKLIDGKIYYFNPDGSMVSNITKYSWQIGADGAFKINTDNLLSKEEIKNIIRLYNPSGENKTWRFDAIVRPVNYTDLIGYAVNSQTGDIYYVVFAVYGYNVNDIAHYNIKQDNLFINAKTLEMNDAGYLQSELGDIWSDWKFYNDSNLQERVY